MIRYLALPSILMVSLGLSDCVDSLGSQPVPVKWTTGFWYWHGNWAQPATAKAIPDTLFVHSGTIRKDQFGRNEARWVVSREWPESRPPAREYWLVFRMETPGVPSVSAVSDLAATVSELLLSARQEKLKVAGIQLDIDCPTGELSQYAEFLREVRRQLPAGTGISITALLDWFRDGTQIADVIKETDEFVPQFYDVDATGNADDYRAIAAKIDPVRWAPKFNRFGKRYRIGISAFGRARLVPREDPSHSRFMLRLFSDLAPIDIAGSSEFNLQASRTEAGELVLNYRAARKARIAYNDFEAGDTVQFILATPESIGTAVESTRRMGGNCAGVVFFRWPASNENMVVQPDDALRAAGLAPRVQKDPGVEAVDGHCAAVSCVDLYLVKADSFSPAPLRYRIRSSVELEYFLPQERVRVRMAGPSDLELKLPAYAGLSRMLLGRAVSATRAEYRLEQEP